MSVAQHLMQSLAHTWELTSRVPMDGWMDEHALDFVFAVPLAPKALKLKSLTSSL